MKSTLWTLKAKDFLKGLILFVGTPVLTIIQQLIPSWTPWLSDHLGQSGALIAQGGLAAFVAYILKNLATDDTKVALKTLSKQNVTVIKNAPLDPNQVGRQL